MPTSWVVAIYAFGGAEEAASRDASLARLADAGIPAELALVTEAVAADGTLRRSALLGHEFREEGAPREASMASPAELADFLRETASRYPDRNVSLIVRGRGYGLGGIGGAGDGPDGGLLDLPGLVDAVKTGLAAAGRERLDLLALDASFTSSLEVALGFVGVADELLGWQGLRPHPGFALEGLADGGNPSGGLFAATAARATAEFTLPEMTLAHLRLDPLAGVPAAFEDISAMLEVPSCPAALLRLGAAVPRPAAMPDVDDSPHDVDVGSLVFLGLRASDGDGVVYNSDLFSGFEDIDRALREAVTTTGDLDEEFLRYWSGAGGTARLQIVHGVSLHLPLVEDQLAPGYERLTWMRPWLEVLRTTWESTRSAPAPAYDYVGEVYRWMGWRDFSGDPARDGFFTQVQHRSRVGLPRPDGSTILLGDERAPTLDWLWLARWDGFRLDLAQDGARESVFLWRPGRGSPYAGGSPLVRVPFEYWPPVATAPERIYLQFFLEEEKPVQTEWVRWLRGGRDGWAEFAPEAGSRIRPLQRIVFADGTERFVAGEHAFDADRPASFQRVRVEAGTPYRLSLQPWGPAGPGAEAVRTAEY